MNKDKSESESKLVLKLLLENLANKGLMITLDALYCVTVKTKSTQSKKYKFADFYIGYQQVMWIIMWINMSTLDTTKSTRKSQK
jgi:hypothetical protein